jgi:4-hydroxy-tetrahydrodipicolinate synthase
MYLQGCYTALVTPFESGKVCTTALRDLVEAQVIGGVDGVVPVGTTGESPTLSMAEHNRVVENVVDAVNGRCTVIAGTGANSTAEALELTQHAKDAGADATLQVSPYYNKPTQEGLYRHFTQVADVGLPVVLYNVPGRCSVEIAIDTVARLAKHPAIIAVKEAGGDVDRVTKTLTACDIIVISGDDALTLPMMVLGAKGVISVASNVLPAEVTELTHLALAGDFLGARESHFRLYELFETLFIETNPIPVKAAVAAMGLITEEYRLPMCEMTPANLERLLTAMRNLDIDV